MKYCGACGTLNEDNAIRCVTCGSFFQDMMNSQNSNNYENRNNSYNDGFNNYGDQRNNNYPQNNGSSNFNNYPANGGSSNSPVEYQPVRNEGGKGIGDLVTNILKFIAIVIVAAVLLGGGIAVYEFTGYRSAINYFEIYFDEYKYEKIVDIYSKANFYNANPDNNYSQLDEDTKLKMENIYKKFDEELNTQDYTLKFKTIENSIMTDEQYNDLMNEMNYPEKDDVILDARIVKLKLTATANGEKSVQNIKLILTLEDNNEWFVYSFDAE